MREGLSRVGLAVVEDERGRTHFHAPDLDGLLQRLDGQRLYKAGGSHGLAGALHLLDAGRERAQPPARPQRPPSVANGQPRLGQVEKDGVSHAIQPKASFGAGVAVGRCHEVAQAVLFKLLLRLLGTGGVEVECVQVAGGCQRPNQRMRQRPAARAWSEMGSNRMGGCFFLSTMGGAENSLEQRGDGDRDGPDSTTTEPGRMSRWVRMALMSGA